MCAEAALSVRHPRARELCARLAVAGVVTDFRGPDVVRLGPPILATRHVDVWDAMERLRDVAGKLA